LPSNTYSYFRSIRHKSVTVGTEFDKIALALVLSQRAHDLRQNFLAPPLMPATTNESTHQNGNIKSEEEIKNEDSVDNNSFVISNPLANISAPGTPSTERKTSASSYNLMVKVVPYS
jgi:hypothetical protein